MIVKQIEAKDTYGIRSAVLRPGLPIETCYFEGDDDENTFHLGAFIDNKLTSVASFYLSNNPAFDDAYQTQLRGMATLPEFQGKGLSSALLKSAFPLIQRNHIKILWCNARKQAVGFYEKVKFELVSDEFDIPGVGPHYLMVRKI